MDNTTNQSTPMDATTQPVPGTDATNQTTSAPVTSSDGSKKKILYVILAVITVLVIAGAGVWWIMTQNGPSKLSTTSAVPQTQATPVPTKSVLQDVDAVDTNDDMSNDFTDVKKDVSSL